MGDRWSTARTEAFSDGVFAIAITLLVLDITVPASDFDDLWRGIADQWPSYLGYVTSFMAIGGMWLSHHGMFRRLRYADGSVVRINLVLLMAVGFLPFPTRLAAEAIGNDDAERVAVIFYGAALLVISILFRVLWRRPPRPRASRPRRAARRGRRHHTPRDAQHRPLRGRDAAGGAASQRPPPSSTS